MRGAEGAAGGCSWRSAGLGGGGEGVYVPQVPGSDNPLRLEVVAPLGPKTDLAL